MVRKTVWQVADPSNILILILDGTCRFEIGSQNAAVSPGDAVFIPAGQTYRRSPCGDNMCKMLYLHFKTGSEASELENEEASRRIMEGVSRADVQLLDEKKNFLAQDAYLYLSLFNTTRRGEVLAAGEDISTASAKYGSDSGLYAGFCMCRVLSLLSRDLKRSLMAGDMETDMTKIPPKLKKAVWYIKQNESGRITLDGLCSYCNVSKSQMIRYF
ncbi:MAG: AraC family ligand binding domain-containing protein, partial [Clostridia bacterium]|nr:AraC family ligand binding domain-containing protein [Clostridia bacterium]